MKVKYTLGLAAILLALAMSASLQAANVTGTCGMVINTAGTYVLQNNIASCNPYNAKPSAIAAITIQADNVILDLNGHKVGGAGSNSGSGISIYGVKNITVKNGTIENFTTGQGIVFLSDEVRVKDPSDIVIEKLTIQKNTRAIYGNRTGTLKNLTIRNNYFTANTSGGAIVLFNVQYGKIYGNQICANGKFGISLDNTSSLEIYQNSISKQTNAGLYLTNHSDYNQVYLNAICYNYYGILNYSGSKNGFDSNSVTKNSMQAIDYDATDVWRSNFWSGHDCANPYAIPGDGNQADRTPVCQPSGTASPCSCGVGSICGYKWNDLNGDGKWSGDEIGLSGWQINLQSPSDPSFAPMSATTARDGSYCFFGLKSSTYTVSETQKENWTETFPPAPGTYTMQLGDSEAAHGINFGNRSWSANPSITVQKDGPVSAYAGDALAFGYSVTNNGNVPVSNVTVTDDKCGAATRQNGDTNLNNKLDPGETWVFACTYTPPFQVQGCLTNIATAAGYYGSQQVKATDDYTLCPFVLRKNIFLYWNRQDTMVPYGEHNNTPFNLKFSKDGAEVGTFTIGQNAPKQLWLSLGTWKFCEVAVPEGYVPGYECVTYTTGQNDSDQGYPNAITYDLKIEKTCPAKASPGETIAYDYTVSNGGPAAVPAIVTDDKCTGVTYKDGDANGNTKVDPGETWTFTCQYTVPRDAKGMIVNTAFVKDPNLPTAPSFLGGDRDPTTNSSTCSVSISDGVGFSSGEFCTYTQGGWGAPPNGNNVAQLLYNNFGAIYGLDGSIEVGIPGTSGYSMLFDNVGSVQAYTFITDYLPSGGSAGALTQDYVNPHGKNESGVFGGQILTLRLNVDFSAANKPSHTGWPAVVGDLKLCNTGTSMDGKTVAQVLATANTALGGGVVPTGLTYATLSDLVTKLNEAFDNCAPSSWAQQNICR